VDDPYGNVILYSPPESGTRSGGYVMENNSLSVNGGGRTRVLIVGAGFAGFTCARELEKRLEPDDAELLLVSPTDYLLYSPLLPEVAAGTIDPRHIAVLLHGRLKRTRVIPGYAVGVDLEARTLTVASTDEPADGTRREVGWDRLVLAPGAVTRTFRIPASRRRRVGSRRSQRRCTRATTS